MKISSLSLMQEGKRLKNTRINLQDEDSTIIAFNTTEVFVWNPHEDGSENNELVHMQ